MTMAFDRPIVMDVGATPGQKLGQVVRDEIVELVPDPAPEDITGSTAVGRAVLTAADQAAARTAIGAGTSSLVVGTTAGTAKAGDYQPDLSSKVDTTRSITAGTGLSGGGDLSADRTLQVTYGTAAGTACVGDDARLADERAPMDGSVTTASFAASALVTSAEGLASSDNDTSVPTTAAVLDAIAGSGGGTASNWGDLGGTLSNQTDLQSALDGKSATGHTHTSANVTDFGEAVRDTMGTALVQGANVTIAVDDNADTITISATGGGGSGDVVGPASSVDSEIALYSGAGGKTLKRATGSGIPKLTAGVLGTAAAGTDYLAPDGSAAALTSFPTLNQSTTGNAATATQLATPRTIRTNLGSTSTASFDGTANVTPGVTGTLAVGNGGTGATSAAAARSALAGFSSIATSAGTTTAVVADPSIVVYTGTTTHTYRLPTTSVAAGDRRLVINDSTGIVTIQSSGANAIVALPPGTHTWLTARQATPTTAAHWHFSRPIWTGTAAAYAALGSYDAGVVYVSDGKRVATVTQSATPTINIATSDVSVINNLAQAITSVSVTGTGKPEQQHVIKVKDNGTGRAITWGASFTGTLLATTVAGKWHRQLVVWDSDVSKWAGMAADTAGY